jgi:hypothetical protein
MDLETRVTNQIKGFVNGTRDYFYYARIRQTKMLRNHPKGLQLFIFKSMFLLGLSSFILQYETFGSMFKYIIYITLYIF